MMSRKKIAPACHTVSWSPSTYAITTHSTKKRSATGSISAPKRETTFVRRAIQPSRKSVSEATAIKARRTGTASIARNPTARITRDVDTRFGTVSTVGVSVWAMVETTDAGGRGASDDVPRVTCPHD